LEILRRFTPGNRVLLEERDRLQALIDAWHVVNGAKAFDPAAYRRFLQVAAWWTQWRFV
jgi:malate synthase